MEPRLTRRRAFAVVAGFGAMAAGIRAQAATTLEWRGTALGADATIIFANADRHHCELALKSIRAEIERLERIFSLHLSSSEISQLNNLGILREPSFDMQALLTQSLLMHQATEGLFDPTVQAIWEFQRSSAASFGGAGTSVPREVLERIDFETVSITSSRIAMRAGMSLTLNGIAQGYITDRIADILRDRGWRDVLIDLGEARALEGRSFDVAIREADRRITLANAALATSSSAPLPSAAGKDLPHLFNPRTGSAAASDWKTLTVRHPSAAVADALSTALILCGPDDTEMAQRILSRFPATKTWITRPEKGDIIFES